MLPSLRLRFLRSRCLREMEFQVRGQRESEKESWKEGVELMRGVLSRIENTLASMEAIEPKIAEERRMKKENWDVYVTKYLQKDLNNTKAHIFELNKKKHKLLNHPNQITRAAA